VIRIAEDNAAHPSRVADRPGGRIGIAVEVRTTTESGCIAAAQRTAAPGHKRSFAQRQQRVSEIRRCFQALQRPQHRYCVVPAIYADRHGPIDRHAAHDAALVAVIIDCLVLCRAIVPDQ